MNDLAREHAEGFVRAFVHPQQRARLLELLTSEKKQAKFRQHLAHRIRLDERWVRRLGTQEGNVDAVGLLLRRLGASDTCVVIDENVDDATLLSDALAANVGQAYGVIVSCLPGALAYYESEDAERCLLHRAGA